MSRSERRVVIALLGLAVLGQGVRFFLDRGEPPGEALLPPRQRAVVAAQREASQAVGNPLKPGDRIDPDRATAQELARLPGIGMRSAERIAFHLLKQAPQEAMKLAEAIRENASDIHMNIGTCVWKSGAIA